MRFETIGGLTLHVLHRPGRADAVPVVFLNSLGTDARIWDAVAARLPEGTPILGMDHRGHGLSEEGPVTIEALAGDMAALMDRHGLARAVLCGVSVGGMVAQALAAARPDLARAALLCCTGHRIGAPASWDARIAAVREGGLAGVADGVLARWLSPGFAEAHPALAAGCRAMLVRTPPEGYAATCAAIRDADLTETAQRLDLPVTCLAGGADGATPPALVAELARLVPGAGLRILPGVGHLPCLEAPDAVAEALADLLARAG